MHSIKLNLYSKLDIDPHPTFRCESVDSILVTVNWSIQMCEMCKLLHASTNAVNFLCNNANLCRGVEMFQDIPRKDSVCSFCLLHFLDPDDECSMHSPGHRVRCYSPSPLLYNASISIRQRCKLLFHETIQEESSLISFHILLLNPL